MLAQILSYKGIGGPLEHYYFLPRLLKNGSDQELIKIVTSTGNFQNYNEIIIIKPNWI